MLTPPRISKLLLLGPVICSARLGIALESAKTAWGHSVPYRTSGEGKMRMPAAAAQRRKTAQRSSRQKKDQERVCGATSLSSKAFDLGRWYIGGQNLTMTISGKQLSTPIIAAQSQNDLHCPSRVPCCLAVFCKARHFASSAAVNSPMA